MIGADSTTRRSEGPPARCAAATAKTLWVEELCGSLGQSSTPVAWRNAAGRLPGGKPCEVAPHARFGKGEQETGPLLPRLLPTSQAYEQVKANKGAPGADEVTLGEFETDLKGNLYKLWNVRNEC